YGMAQLFGKGVPKDETGGLRNLRRAAEAGSTRAMLVLANVYYKGDYGVGYNPSEAKRLLTQAADRGDPSAEEALANLERNLGPRSKARQYSSAARCGLPGPSP
ncbi:MAG TPA: hypothetical protein VFQ31_07280, partial [Methyloceanibacter sp.]|nr:hypothetical protein [Methyloceanibacter sp.]